MHTMSFESSMSSSAADTTGWQVPERPVLEGLEDRWAARWRDEGTYAFSRPESREQVYSIDTPPPTASASSANAGQRLDS